MGTVHRSWPATPCAVSTKILIEVGSTCRRHDLRLFDVDLERRAVTTEWWGLPGVRDRTEASAVFLCRYRGSRCCRHDRPGVSDRPGTPYAFSHLIVDDDAKPVSRIGPARLPGRALALATAAASDSAYPRESSGSTTSRARNAAMSCGSAASFPADRSNPDKTTPQSAWGMSLHVLRHSVLT
jgi:hypothetical protein